MRIAGSREIKTGGEEQKIKTGGEEQEGGS